MSASFAQSNAKFAYVEYQAMTDSVPSKVQADKEMNSFVEEGQKTIEELQTMLQRDYDLYMGARDSLSEFMIERKEKDLQEQQQIIQLKQQSLQEDLQTYNDRLYAPIEKSLKAAVKIVSEKHKINYVFEKSSLMYVSGGMDITEEVKAELLIIEKARMASN